MFKRKGLIVLLVMIALVLANLYSPFRIRSISIRLAAEPLGHVGPLPITNTLLASWLAMLLLAVGAWLTSRKLVDVPKALSLQNVVETAFELLYNFMQSLVGARARDFFPVVGTFFLFILTSNWLGLLPGVGSVGLWEDIGGQRTLVPFLRGTTTDLNTTVALGLCSVLSLQMYGVRQLGFWGYLSRFFAVGKLAAFFRALIKGEAAHWSLLISGFIDLFVGILEIFEDLTKVLSFSFRLFGNVFGGEVLLLVIAFLAPYAASLPFLALELFGGFIQAVIFAVLTTAFLGRATATHEHQPATPEEQPAPALAGEPLTPQR